MQIRYVILAAIAGLALTACAPQGGEPAIDVQAEAEAVRAVEMTFLDFARQRDATASSTLFTEDAVLFRENADPYIGIDAVRARLAQEYEEADPNMVQTSEVDYTEVAPSGELAFQYGTWTTSVALESGNQEDRGNYLTVYRKVDGAWKIAVDVSLSTKPEGDSQ